MDRPDMGPETDQPSLAQATAALARMVGSGVRVLDIGCSNPLLAAALRDDGCSVTGVSGGPLDEAEGDPYAELIVSDLDSFDASILEGKTFDVILFADALEHLKAPKSALRESRVLLGDGGNLVVSVRNVAHASVRLSLLRGQFDLEETGAGDGASMRYFTRSSITDMLRGCGYMVDVVDSVELPVSSEELRETLDPMGLANLEEVVKAFSDWEASAYEYIIRAFPASEDARLQELAEEKIAAENRLRVLEREISEYRKMAEGMEKLEEQLAEAQAHIAQSSEYAKSLESQIAEKNDFIAQLEQAVAESRCRLEDCEAQIGGMAAAFKEIEASQSSKKRKWF